MSNADFLDRMELSSEHAHRVVAGYCGCCNRLMHDGFCLPCRLLWSIGVAGQTLWIEWIDHEGGVGVAFARIPA